MRMRKRAVPPSPELSDLRLRLEVQLPQPSDLHRLIRHDLLPFRSAGYLLQKESENGKTNEEQKAQEIHYSSKQTDQGAVAVNDDNGVAKLQIPLANDLDGVGVTTPPARWCEREKAIPLKKRKMSLEMNGVTTREFKCRMKSITNKNCGHGYEEDDNSTSSDSSSYTMKKKRISKKKKKRKRVIMEGSRCSRVNGRGWRCMQPTLVGYSLCDHHLGKGKVRFINSTSKRRTTQELGSSKFIIHCGSDEGEVDEEEEDDGRKKRKRVGMVKARSLSSLLCQPNTIVQASSSLPE